MQQLAEALHRRHTCSRPRCEQCIPRKPMPQAPPHSPQLRQHRHLRAQHQQPAADQRDTAHKLWRMVGSPRSMRCMTTVAQPRRYRLPAWYRTCGSPPRGPRWTRSMPNRSTAPSLAPCLPARARHGTRCTCGCSGGSPPSSQHKSTSAPHHYTPHMWCPGTRSLSCSWHRTTWRHLELRPGVAWPCGRMCTALPSCEAAPHHRLGMSTAPSPPPASQSRLVLLPGPVGLPRLVVRQPPRHAVCWWVPSK